jgi:choline dehydrogenase-like flavoprotein
LIATRIDPATNFTTTADFQGYAIDSLEGFDEIFAYRSVVRYIQAALNTIKHPIGTCAMAPQNIGGVVDSSLKVYGTDNVRVVDASIFPQHLAAHMQATVYAIGEKVCAAVINVVRTLFDISKAADIIASGSSTGNTSDAQRHLAARWALLGVIATSSLYLIFALF